MCSLYFVSVGLKRANRKDAVPFESNGKIPQWSTLPFEILVSILAFASGPPYYEDFRSNPSNTWLLSAARICKAFTEPAITVLYRDPPLWSLERPHGLLETLKKPMSEKLFAYNVKVKRLQFDVVRSLAYTSPGRGLFEVASLIPHIPQIEEIDIFNSLRTPLLRGAGRHLRWTYSAKLFAALEENSIYLKSWQWDADLCPWSHGLSKVDWIANVHTNRAFRSLRKLSLVNFNISNLGLKGRHQLDLDDFSVCERFSDLPELRQMVCDSSDLVDEIFLQYVPAGLTHLTLSNCTSLLAESLRSFLESHGSHLLELHLTHNQSLNLSFLPGLGKSCSALQVFKVNMNYYKAIRSLQDSEPVFDELIGVDEVPTWPSSLRTLEMVHLRKWGTETATMLFTSLINAASNLPDLRQLTLKAILNIGWRDRVHFRKEWIGKIEKVFKRISPEPDPHLMTMRMFNHWKRKQVTAIDWAHEETSDGDLEITPISKAAVVGRRSLRKRGAMSTQEEESAITRERQQNEDYETLTIQGMCEVVDVRIDNLRPAESQFTEGDFLDSDRDEDDDGEWNGEDMYSD